MHPFCCFKWNLGTYDGKDEFDAAEKEKKAKLSADKKAKPSEYSNLYSLSIYLVIIVLFSIFKQRKFQPKLPPRQKASCNFAIFQPFFHSL
jgi:hypothetical protein